MNIGFLTFHTLDSNYASYAVKTAEEKKEYCTRQGYTFYNFNTIEENFSPEWAKIIYCLKLLDKHDWIFWLDADAMITNYYIRLDNFIDNNVDVITSNDVNGMNTGSFFIKNSSWSFEFLKGLYNLRIRFENKDPEIKANMHGQFTDQDAMIYLYNNNWNKIKERFKFIDKKLINAYAFQNCSPNDWQPGDFILHAPATPNRAPLFDSIRKYVYR